MAFVETNILSHQSFKSDDPFGSYDGKSEKMAILNEKMTSFEIFDFLFKGRGGAILTRGHL